MEDRLKDLLLPVPIGSPIDSRVFEIIKNNNMPASLTSMEKYELKRRLFHVGDMLLKYHNCLAQPGDYQKLEPLLRKCFSRLKYILQDVTKGETTLIKEIAQETTETAAAEE